MKNLRPLVVNEEVRKRVAEIKAYAERTTLSLAQIVRMVGKPPDEAIGNDVNYCVEIPFGYRVVYSQEYQPIGKCAHLSVSVDSKFANGEKALPSQEAVLMIMSLFGMPSKLEDCAHVGTEEIEEGGGAAVNVISKMD